MFKWKESFSCNIKEIDNQHKTLFDLGQKIYNIVSLNDGYDHYDEILNTISELQNYTVYHFNYEEKLMEDYNYPDIENHKKQHKAFIHKVANLDEEYIDEHQKKISMDLLVFILDWIGNHILKSDMNYKDFLNKKGVF